MNREKRKNSVKGKAERVYSSGLLRGTKTEPSFYISYTSQPTFNYHYINTENTVTSKTIQIWATVS